MRQRSRGSRRKRDVWRGVWAQVWGKLLARKWVETFKRKLTFSQQSLNQWCLSVQLIALILASVLLKAPSTCPAAKPQGRKANTSKPATQLLADFKETLRRSVPLRCLSPATAKVTRVTLAVVLFMPLDFRLLKPFGALRFAPHLLTANTKHTHKYRQTHT